MIRSAFRNLAAGVALSFCGCATFVHNLSQSDDFSDFEMALRGHEHIEAFPLQLKSRGSGRIATGHAHKDANGILISGFRIPALRTRRMETTVDVQRDQSMIISGLFSNTQERVRTGIPYLQDLPILGALFSTTRWQTNETELLVVVTPVLVDPRDPRPQDVLRMLPDTALPARPAIEKRLQPTSKPPSPIIR